MARMTQAANLIGEGTATPMIPANAIRVWTDGMRIYAAIGDYISAYPLTEGALSQIIDLMKVRRVDYSLPPVRTTTPTTLKEATAQSILRRLGIL